MWKRDSQPKVQPPAHKAEWQTALEKAEAPLRRFENEIMKRLTNGEPIGTIATEYSRATMIPSGRIALYCLGLIKRSEARLFLYAKQPELYKKATAIEFLRTLRGEEVLARSNASELCANGESVDLLLILTLPYLYIFSGTPPRPTDSFPATHVARLEERRGAGVRMRDIYSAIPHEARSVLAVELDLGTMWLRPPTGQGNDWLWEWQHLLSRACMTF